MRLLPGPGRIKGMKTVPLYGAKAAGRVARVDDWNYELVMSYRWCVWERERAAYYRSGPYAVSGGWGGARQVRMHNLLMPGVRMVDHWDGDGLNCQEYNLREATTAQNGANRGKQGIPSSSQFKGVYWHKGKGSWRALIQVDGKRSYLGQFADEAEAAMAYDAAARAAFGAFARLNFPEAR